MKKNKNNDEIDLIEIFFFVIKNKWKIFLITAIASFLGYAYSFNKIPIYKVETEVRGISSSDEFMYQTYNSYLNKKKTTIIASDDNGQKISVLNDFQRIDKETLINLFIDKLYDQQSLIQILKKSEYLNKESYQNSENYENAIKSLSSSIKIRLPDNNREKSNFFIETKTTDLKKWENLLIFIDKFVNEEIKNDIVMKFNTQLNSEKILRKYQIEDLQDEINNLTKVIDDHRNNNNFIYELRELENQKKMLVANLTANKDIYRMKSLFGTTPIKSQDEFYAAKIMHLNTKFDTINSADKLVITLIFGFVGLIISILYIYIVNSFKNRK
jgi:LPS O-antigen subunit length determinant protein (WzzB/FepE family)